MLLADVIQEAIDGFEELFSCPPETCYVLQKDLKTAIDDDQENGKLTEVCELVDVRPIDKGLPGHHVWAGKVLEDSEFILGRA